jgi:hypothetical protein
MIKRPTWILLIVLGLVLVAYFVIKSHPLATSIQATPTALGNNFLVTQSDGTLQILRIYDQQNHVVQMQRDTSGTWIVTLPTPGTADQALAGAAETQVGSLRIVTTLDNQLNLADAGLDSPAYTIELTFISGLKHVVQVGTLTPTNSGYYVRYDEGNLYVVSQSGIDALLNLLTAPPFPATETLLPTIEDTVTPTLEVVTPTPTFEVATPTP